MNRIIIFYEMPMSIKEIVNYSIKFDAKIKKITSPLNDCLSIPIFTYYKIYKDGTFLTLSNFTEQLDFYYQEDFYLSNPYLVSPKLMKSGCVFTADTEDPEYRKSVDISRNKYNMTNTFLMVYQSRDSCEGYLFGNKNSPQKTNYIENIFALKKFVKYFKIEVAPILNSMASDKFNLIEAKKELFFKRSPLLPLSPDMPTEKFLRAINPLSEREQECLELYLNGRSAQATAATLNLSQRTVEHYFENILDKLGCRFKSELHAHFCEE